MYSKSENKIRNDLRLFGNPKVMCTAAVLCALAVAIASACKIFTITINIRITFENLPIILSGLIFGPFVGFVTGLAADLISAVIFYGVGGINPIITLGAGCVGLTAGILSRILPQKHPKIRLALCVFIPHMLGNMVVKSAGLMIWYSTPFVGVLPRIPLYTVIAIIEYIVLLALLQSKGLKKAIGDYL